MPPTIPSPDKRFNDLVLALEIELLVMRDKNAFRRRLKQALAEAYAKGAMANKALS
jgi:hypothetical protein